jgi:hypothetical protein
MRRVWHGISPIYESTEASTLEVSNLSGQAWSQNKPADQTQDKKVRANESGKVSLSK